MEDKKEELSSLATTESSNNSSSNNNHTTQTSKRQRSFPRKGRPLHVDSKVNALAIKCYDEQLPKGWDYTKKKIIELDSNEYYVEAICHYRDTYAEDGSFWKVATEKCHYHILFKCKKSKGAGSRIRVKKVMEMLGIFFRDPDDKELWNHHGVETIRKSFAGYSLYLTHDTQEAIADGKEQYDLSEVVSNLTTVQLTQIREGYLRLVDPDEKVTIKTMSEIDDVAFNLGKELMDFSEWYDSLDFMIRSHSKMKTVKESYQRGVDRRIVENNIVLRLCVFIKGKPNTGKTYAALAALKNKRILTVEGGGSGKFDNLRPDHEAIIISDDVCPNLLNMSDNYICRAYRRQSNNPAWAGQYLIITCNNGFEDWVKDCGIKNPNHVEALRSRFFICEVDRSNEGCPLKLITASTRGTLEEREERMNMFMEFQKKANESLNAYTPPEPEKPEHDAEQSEKERYLNRNELMVSMITSVANDTWMKLYKHEDIFEKYVKAKVENNELKTIKDIYDLVILIEQEVNKKEEQNDEGK